MIGQCLSNKNKNATIAKSKKISELNKAKGHRARTQRLYNYLSTN
jgi:hypothetical protein